MLSNQYSHKGYFYFLKHFQIIRKNALIRFLRYHTRIDHNYLLRQLRFIFIKELIRLQVARPLILSLIRPNQSEQNLTPELNFTSLSHPS